MKTVLALSVVLGLFTGTAYGGKVALTADQVTSALDIEAAIHTATAFGSERGIVVLDGRKGDFTYTGPDRSINIFVSALSLHGINGATITNCADGVFFDDVPIRNIRIENIVFRCTGNGVNRIGTSLREDVRIKANVFDVGGLGIEIENAARWTIHHNIIDAGTAGQAAIALTGSSKSIIKNNTLSGFFGVRLVDSTEISTLGNKIEAVQTGVRLDGATSDSRVSGNTIIVELGPCIFLGPGTAHNVVTENKCFCLGLGGCETVQDLGTGNRLLDKTP